MYAINVELDELQLDDELELELDDELELELDDELQDLNCSCINAWCIFTGLFKAFRNSLILVFNLFPSVLCKNSIPPSTFSIFGISTFTGVYTLSLPSTYGSASL